MANRIYANAGIKFTFDPASGFLDVTDPDLNCWYDDPQDDEATASWYADSYPEAVVTIVPYYGSPNPAMQRPCVPTPCWYDYDCCPDDWDSEQGGCRAGVGGAPVVSCAKWPGLPNPLLGVCAPTSFQGPGAQCFTPGTQCTPKAACDVPAYNETNHGWTFMRFLPLWDNVSVTVFAHEVGHHFGLWHTFDPVNDRCYNTGEGVPSKNCGDLPWPGTPLSCTGQYYDCLTNTPYCNVMSYFSDCEARYSGQWSSSGWNMSLSQDQIAIIWRSLDEYWDRDVASTSDVRPFEYGGYERMQVAMSSSSREYRGQDSWNTVWYLPVGDAGWTKGNVMIAQGDFNGDRQIDAIVSTLSGSHPGISLWLRQPLGNLVFQQTLLGTSWCNVLATLQVGNITGDMADDLVAGCGSLTWVFRGGVGAATMACVGAASWPQSSYKVLVGNFGGTPDLAVPMPSRAGYDVIWAHQLDIDKSGRYNNISFDDILVLSQTDAKVYYGGSSLDLTTAEVTTTTYNADTTGIWAGNVAGDYHDELLIRSGNYIKVLKGQDVFSFSTVVTNLAVQGSDEAVVSLGDFAGDHHADILRTSTSAGTRLYLGDPATPTSTTWYRTDLVPSNTRHVVSDFIRGGRDDVMFFTTSGSWLYAGTKAPTYLTENVWSTGSLAYPNIEWFGRR